MSPNRKTWRWRCRAFLLLPFFALPLVLLAQTKGSKRGGGSEISGTIRPDLLNAQVDPTLRFPVMSMSGSTTYGWLDITSSTIRYSVVQPANKANLSFEVSRYAVRDPRFSGSVLTFKTPRKEQMIIYLPQDAWGSGRRGSDSARERLGTSSIYNTLMNFDVVLASVKPPPPPPAPVVVQTVVPPPPPKPVAPPAPPAIVVASPSGAGENQTVEMNESTLVIRGVAMDSTGIPVVSINGTPANMRPQNPQAAEFWSDPLPLQTGNNPILITATNSAHVEAKVAFTVHYAPKAAPVNPKALDKAEIISLLQGAVPASRVAGIVQERGIKFTPTADDLNEIRAAGGSDELIQAIQQAAPPK